MTTFLQDLRYALRTLARSPGFTAAAAATLALGIGANAAVFSVVSGVLIKPLPFPAAERIVRIWSSNPARGLAFFSVSAGDYREWKAQSKSFEAMAAYERQRPAALAARDGAKEVMVAGVSPDLFDLLGVRPLAGRAFAAGSRSSPARDAREVVLADGFRRRELGEDADAIGRSLTLNGQPYTVVGVMPPGFAIPNNPAELWMRLDLSGEPDHGNRFLRVLGRLAPGAGLAQARTELQTIARRLQMHDPGTNQGWDVALRTLTESVVGETFGRSVLILFGVVSVVLLIACANVAGLWIARGASRQREIAVRMALGASRGRLVRQLLTESAALGVLAAVIGILVAWGGLELLRSIGPAAIPRLESVRMDAGMLAFALAVSLLTSLLFGLVPAMKLSRPDLDAALRAGARGSGAGRGGRKVRSLLVAGQIGLALVLLIGAGLLIQSLVRLQRLDLGFAPANLVTARLSPPEESYPDRERVAAFYRELLGRIHEIPGVASAAAVSLAPLRDSNSANSFFAEGWRPADRSAAPDADFRVVTAGYFETMGIPVRAGRGFSPRDDASAPAVAVIDQTMARRYWPGADPVGKRLRLGDIAKGPWLTIAGVAGDATYGDPTAPVRRPMIYLPLPQTESRAMTLVLRVAAGTAPPAAALRQEVSRLDANLPLSSLLTMSEAVANALAQRRFTLLLFAVFAGIALLLAAVGVYGLVSYLVALRTREMGIRLALGARPADLVALVLRQGLRLSLAGVAAGLAAAAILTRFLESQLYGTRAGDPVPFAVAAASLLAVALLASGLPARRAARVDPIAALRSE